MVKFIRIKNKNENYNVYLKTWGFNKTPKEVFIFCHGFASSSESTSISILADELLKSNIASVAFDFPLHGKSKTSRDKLTLKNCIDDLSFVEKYIKSKFGNVEISLFGVSFGGYVILNKLLKNDQQYKHIILRAPAIQMGQILKNILIKEDIDNLDKTGFVKAGLDSEIEVTKQFYNECLQNDISNVKFDQKMLIIQGSLDTTAEISKARKFANNNKNVELVEMPDSEHKMSLPEKQKVAEIAMKYILKSD